MSTSSHISLIDSCFNKFRNEHLKNRTIIEAIDLKELKYLIKSEVYEYLDKNKKADYVDLKFDLVGVNFK